MKISRIVLGLVVVIALVLLIMAPLGPVPGLFIGGTPSDAPRVWMDTDEVHEIQLRVPGTLPRVVTLWVVDVQGELYVFGERSSTWVEMIGAGSPVHLKLEENTYLLEAVVVTEGWEPIYQAYLDKYRPDYPDLVASFPTMGEAFETGAIYRLSRSG